MSVICTKCYTEAQEGDAFCQCCGNKLDLSNENVEGKRRSTKDDMPTRKEYKILTQKDKWFSGKFNPQALEEAINAYAQQGWRVVSSATADFPSGFSSSRQEMIIILERNL